ncbi:MAG: hypothetical protein WA673_02810 [Candidatus Acidiferrales bacterium]
MNNLEWFLIGIIMLLTFGCGLLYNIYVTLRNMEKDLFTVAHQGRLDGWKELPR